MVTLSLNASSEEQYPDEPLIVILTIFFMLICHLVVTLTFDLSSSIKPKYIFTRSSVITLALLIFRNT